MRAAYGIEFCAAPDVRTLLAEVNHAYSRGHVGLRPAPYTTMREDRGAELVAGANRTGEPS